MRLGFIGSGTIASAMVAGLSSMPDAGLIVLSPRNAKIAADLASRFANVRVAPTNQAVLDACEVAVLAVRPQIAPEVISELHFRPDHQVLSLIATLPIRQIRPLVAPATSITRAVPLPSVARRQGPTAVYPSSLTIMALFNALGTAVELSSENEFDTFLAATAIMGSYFSFANTVTSWMTRQGIAPENAYLYVGKMLQGLAGASSARPNGNFASLAHEHQTPGGLNEQLLRLVTRDGLFTDLDSALDAVLKRIQEAGSGRSS
jgi:pyrroline-5-carboxylate reductase